MYRLLNVLLTLLIVPIFWSGVWAVTPTDAKFLPADSLEQVRQYDLGSTGNVYDALVKLSGIRIDESGNISMQGLDNVSLWIDGVASGLKGKFLLKYLKSLAAFEVSKVELRPYKSSSEAGNSTSGVIDIYLSQGSNRNLSYQVSTLGSNTLAMGYEMKREKFSLSSALDCRYENSPFTSRVDEADFGRYDTTYSRANSKFDERGYSTSLRLGVKALLSNNDVLTFSIYNNFGKATLKEIARKWEQEQNISLINSEGRDADLSNIGHAKGGFVHKFAPSKVLQVNGIYFHKNGRTKSDYAETSSGLDDALEPATSYKKKNRNYHQNYGDLSLEYSDLWGRVRVQLGYGYLLNRSFSFLKVYRADTSKVYAQSPSDNNRFSNLVGIHSLFSNTIVGWKSILLRVGLRGEYASRKTRVGFYEIADQTGSVSTRKNYFSLLPSLQLSYIVKEGTELSLTYDRRVVRPDEDQINLFPSVDDSINVSIGNPLLKPSYINSANVRLARSWRGYILDAALFYRKYLDMIEPIKFDYNNITYATFANVTNAYVVGAHLEITAPLLKWVTLNTSLNGYRYHYRSFNFGKTYVPENQNNTFSVKGNLTFSIVENLKAIVDGEYQSTLIRPLGYELPTYGLNFSILKALPNYGVEINLQALDILGSDQHRTVTEDITYYQSAKTRLHRGMFCQLSVSWNFK